MVSALTSGIEKLRLSTLRRYGILDTGREEAFDDLAALAATACGTPAAWIGLVDGDRLWFKATFGFERGEIPRGHALCDDALDHPDVFVVKDTLGVPSYADSPLVRGGPRARFYAAAPLVTNDGYRLGSIAVADHAPRGLEPAHADALRALARQIVTLLEARLAETLNRRALELSSDIIYMTDDGGRFTFVNPVATRILGYELPELLGKHYLELIRPDFREAVAEFYSRQSGLRENSTYFEFPAVAKDGTEVWFGQNVQIVTDGRKVTGFHAVARDITARRQAEDALRRSEERLRQALLSTNGGIWEYCLGSQKFTWSDDFYRLLGMEPGEREPSVESWLERVHPDDRAWVRETAATSLGESGELDIEYRVVSAGGRVRWLNVKGKAVRNDTAGAARYAGIALDITARKTAEEEARRASEYANLFRYASDPILVLDPDSGRILDASRKAGECYGRDLSHLIGATLDAISTGPAAELRLLSEHAASGESFEFEADHYGDRGRIVHLLVSASFIDYRGGRAVLCINRDITQRARHEEALRRSEERYRVFVANSSEAIWRIEFEQPIPASLSADEQIELCYRLGHLAECNDAMARMYGFDRASEIIGIGLEQVLPAADPKNLDYLRRIVESGHRLTDAESVEVDREGHKKYFVNNLVGVVEGGFVVRVWGTQRDVTERKRAEEGLAQQRAFLRQVIDLNPNFIFAKDEAGRVTLANEALAKAYGTTTSGIVGKTDLDLAGDPSVAQHFLRADREVLETGREQTIPEEMFLDAEGRVRWLQTTKRRIASPDGSTDLMLGVATDITSRKEAAERLRVSEARYRQLIEQASDGIVLFTADGTILESNNRICEITGRTCDDLVGSNVADYLNREDLLAEPIRYRELLSGDTLLTNRRVVRADGTLVPVEITARVLTGEKKVILAIVRDVTERRRAEEMLRRSEEQLFKAQRMEAIGQLAGGVAHDFNNILTGVFGFTDLALRQVQALEAGGKTEATGRLRQNLEEVKDAGQRGAGLTKQLLAFSRQQQLAQRSIDINQTITGLLGLLRRLIEENVTMHFYPGADRSTVSADAGQIGQVLLNLAANARDAMPTGGRLVIETADVTLDDAYVERHPYARAGRYLLIRVSDTGTGMPEHVRSRIFEPFFTTKDVDKGTGLGLSTAYGIVKQHNGTVEVYSEPGHGTTFKIYLPLESGPAEKVVEPERPRLVGGAETVLVVEDDPSLERLARQYLEELGYRVVCAQNGRDAVKVYEARHRDIDLILLDVIMPGLDGPEALREMRELVPDTPPVVFMTGYSPEVVRARLEEELNAGAGLLPKPYTLAEIGAKVREALDAKRGGGA